MVRRGTLLLTPENTIVLGGQASTSLLNSALVWSSLCLIWMLELQVDDLEAARQKALKRWNQPACKPPFDYFQDDSFVDAHPTCICSNLLSSCTMPSAAPGSYKNPEQ